MAGVEVDGSCPGLYSYATTLSDIQYRETTAIPLLSRYERLTLKPDYHLCI